MNLFNKLDAIIKRSVIAKEMDTHLVYLSIISKHEELTPEFKERMLNAAIKIQHELTTIIEEELGDDERAD